MNSTTADSTMDADHGHDARFWQTNCGGLSSRLGALRAKGIWTDCEIIVGSTQERLSAHRVLLGSASPVLAAMFYGPLAQSDGVVHIPNIEHDIFNRMLEFIYTDNIKVDSTDDACSLYAAANFLNMPHVETVCKTQLLNNLSEESALQIYEFANMFGEEDMREKALDLMCLYANEIFSDKVLCLVSADTMELLFAQPGLTCMSELEMLSMAERWVSANTTLVEGNEVSIDKDHQEKGAGEENTLQQNLDIKTENPKTAIRKALQHIRFLAIDAKEFARRDMSTLLEEKEILAISLNIISRDSYIPMPKGFSTSKEPRCKIITLIKSGCAKEWKGSCEIFNMVWCFRLFNKAPNNDDIEVGVSIEVSFSDVHECETKIRANILSHKNISSWNVINDNKFICVDWYERTTYPTNLSLHELTDPENGYINSNDKDSIRLKVVAKLDDDSGPVPGGHFS